MVTFHDTLVTTEFGICKNICINDNPKHHEEKSYYFTIISNNSLYVFSE